MTSVADPTFQRAFVALSYLVGRRDAELTAALGAVHPEATQLVRRLAHPERQRRAELLARELSRVAIALDERRVK